MKFKENDLFKKYRKESKDYYDLDKSGLKEVIKKTKK